MQTITSVQELKDSIQLLETEQRIKGENISGISAGITGGYLLKKLFVGRSGYPFKKLLGSIIQFGLTNLIAQNSQLIKSFAAGVFRLFSEKNK